MSRPKLTALVHTLNEADQILDCLATLDWADEILLLDSFSTDGTIEVVKEKFPGVRVVQREYLGAAAQKNYGLDNVSHDWVLVVDADERVTPELRDEILRTLEAPKYWAYWIGRTNYVLGRRVRFSGLQRDGVRRLMHRGHARYPKKRVHADLVVDGPVGRLKSKFTHYYIRSFDHQAAKMTRYGVWGATQLYVEGRRTSALGILGHAFSRFFRDYFLNLGILDGAPGLVTVGLHTYYTFWKYAKLWECQRLADQGLQPPIVKLETDDEVWRMPWEEGVKGEG
jgi:glycosyltransferase involved in cell wall biosynthesis